LQAPEARKQAAADHGTSRLAAVSPPPQPAPIMGAGGAVVGRMGNAPNGFRGHRIREYRSSMGEGWEGVAIAKAKASMRKHPIAGARDRARSLRRDMTDAEKSIWRILRLYQIDGHRFRRQVPLGHYIADFVCRLIIEIDGGQHQGSAPQEAGRTRFLQDQGYRVLRFWNSEVLSNLEGVRATIAENLRCHPLPTLPHQGGGL
jgi:very-short-patch-repair endonuclease